MARRWPADLDRTPSIGNRRTHPGRARTEPGDELVRFCAEHDVDLAVLSLTNPAVSELADATDGRIRAAGTPTIVGGPGRSFGQLVDDARASTAAATAAT